MGRGFGGSPVSDQAAMRLPDYLRRVVGIDLGHLKEPSRCGRVAAQELVRLRVRRLALMPSTCTLELGAGQRPRRPAQPRSWRVTW